MNKKRFAFLMLIGAFVMLVSCNTSKVTENNSPYYPFYDPSVAPAPKDVAGYTEKMGIKRILSSLSTVRKRSTTRETQTAHITSLQMIILKQQLTKMTTAIFGWILGGDALYSSFAW